MIIRLSDYVKLRPQQIPLFKAYFSGVRNVIRIAHRRFGKGMEAFTLMRTAALNRRGIYGYFLPTIGQARRVIWQTISSDGTPLLDKFPSQLMSRINHSEQLITMANGSKIYVSGSDNYKRLIGMDFCHIVWDEYQDTNPAAVDAFRPMITRNKGFQQFVGTPRAFNHFKDLYDEHVDDPSWFVTNLTIRDTYDEYGNPIITDEDIEAERRNGMPEELIQQEYFGSFDAAVRGAYYSKQLIDARKEGRIGAFKPNPMTPVYTCWDLGFDDATAIWFFQQWEGNFFFVDYYESREQGLEHYIDVLKQKQQQWRIRYSIHWAPHDIENHELMTGKSRKDIAKSLGLHFKTVQRPERKIHGIHCVRHYFPKFFFNEATCKLGLRHLTEYRADYNEKNNVYSLQPKRNEATHCADSLQTMVLGWMRSYDSDGYQRQIQYANLYGATNF